MGAHDPKRLHPMKALAAVDTGHLELVDVADPAPRPGDVLVEVHAISLNRGELHRLHDAAPGWRPGWDFTGVVIHTDDPARSVGERVFGVVQEAAWAERVAVPPGYLAHLPDQVSFAQAAALPVAGLTAMRILELGGPLGGARVLIVGAAGGVGRLAVQLAHLSGATVTAVVGSAGRATRLQQLGASDIVVGISNAHDEYDFVLESAGGESLAHALELVAAGGTVVSFGNSARERTCFDVSPFYAREAELRGFYLWRDALRRAPAEDLEELARLVAAGNVVVEVGLCLPWNKSSVALDALSRRMVSGKAVLTLDESGDSHE